MIPASNIYLAPDYKHLADGAVCTAAAAEQTHTHARSLSQKVAHIVEILHTLANVTLSGPDRRTEGGRTREKETETETEGELGAEG